MPDTVGNFQVIRTFAFRNQIVSTMRVTREQAIYEFDCEVYAMIKANAQLDTMQGRRVWESSKRAEFLDSVTVGMYSDSVTFRATGVAA
jgi:heat shock protein HslJ